MTEGSNRAISRQNVRQLWSRAFRIAKFDPATFKELKEDRTATGQAVAILLLVGISYGVGFSFFTVFQTHSLTLNGLIVGTMANMILTDFAVFIWSATVFLVGTKLFQGKTGYWELARPLFFSTIPGVLFVFIAIPFSPVVVAVAVVAAAWIVSAEFVALKSAMGFSTSRALLTSVVGLLIIAFIQMTI